MIDLLSLVDKVLALSSVSVAAVSKALDVHLSRESENPYWVFYEGATNEHFERVNLNLSKDGSRWLLAWNYHSNAALLESEVELKRFGEIKNMQVNPKIMPEGTVIYEFERMKTKILVEFSSISRRLRGIALHKD